MIKKQLLVALLLLLLIPVIVLGGGFLSSLINPEVAAGHSNKSATGTSSARSKPH
jgi:hypothetical protein